MRNFPGLIFDSTLSISIRSGRRKNNPITWRNGVVTSKFSLAFPEVERRTYHENKEIKLSLYKFPPTYCWATNKEAQISLSPHRYFKQTMLEFVLEALLEKNNLNKNFQHVLFSLNNRGRIIPVVVSHKENRWRVGVTNLLNGWNSSTIFMVLK